jgi:hypothetical protein
MAGGARALAALLEGGEAPGWPGGLEPGAATAALAEAGVGRAGAAALVDFFGRCYRRGRLEALPPRLDVEAGLRWPQQGLAVVPWPALAPEGRYRVAAGEVRLRWTRREEGPGARARLDGPPRVEGGALVLRFRREAGGGSRAALHREAEAALAAAPGHWRAALEGGPPLRQQIARFTARGHPWRLVHPALSSALAPALDAALWSLRDRDPGAAAAARAAGRALIDALERASRAVYDLWTAPPEVATRRLLWSLDRLPEPLQAKVLADDTHRAWWAGLLGAEAPAAGDRLPVDPARLPADLAAALAALPERAPEGRCVRGENRRALAHLQRAPGRLRAVYIDPPYNTGLSFLGYPDRVHSGVWLSAMAERLELARTLLREDGALFVSIDDREGARLKLLLGAIFEERNHLATLVWEKVHTRKNSARTWSIQHEYVHAVARDAARWTRRLLPRQDTSAYRNPDDDPRGPWKPDPVTAHNPYGADYTITRPDGQVLSPPPERYWSFSKENFERLDREGAVIWGERGYPMVKRYLADVQDGLVPVTLLDRKVAGDTAAARRALREMFGGALVFDYPKPVRLLEEVLYPACPGADDEVLDFFAGSGTTAHAVIGLNRQDGGRRRFVLVERGEVFDEVLLPRVLKALYADRWRAGRPVAAAPRSYTLEILELKPWLQQLREQIGWL